MRDDLRVAVVGGGVIGLACAWRLAGEGARVTVFDAAAEAREASWAAAGMLAPHNEAEGDGPLWRLGRLSLERWPAFLRDLSAEPAAIDYRAHGSLTPLLDAEARRSAEARVAFLARNGIDCRWLVGDALRAAEPALAAPAALALPGGHCDPRLLTALLRRRCADRGVELCYACPVAELDEHGVVTRSGGYLRCDVVVLAAGAWTPALARLAGLELPGEAVKGQMLRLGSGGEGLRHFLHSDRAYCVPRQDGSVVVGSTMVCAGFDRSEDAEAIDGLAIGARHLLPALADAPITETWTGLRPRLPGGLPCIDRVTERLLIATGHFRNGILLTPITAELVADRIYERRSCCDMRPFALAAVHAATH